MTIPMTAAQVVDEYFIEHRTKLLDIAAFLDRLERAGLAEGDFRVRAFRHAVEVLLAPAGSGPTRVREMLVRLSDPTTEPLEAPDTKSAYGAFRDADNVEG